MKNLRWKLKMVPTISPLTYKKLHKATVLAGSLIVAVSAFAIGALLKKSPGVTISDIKVVRGCLFTLGSASLGLSGWALYRLLKLYFTPKSSNSSNERVINSLAQLRNASALAGQSLHELLSHLRGSEMRIRLDDGTVVSAEDYLRTHPNG